MGFWLGKGFDKEPSNKERWQKIMTVIADNVVIWYQEDIFSKKLGALLSKYAETHQGSLSELLILLVMSRQRPPGWEEEIERFIVRTRKNSFYLFRVYASLMGQFKMSFATERTRQGYAVSAVAMSIAKHTTGVKHPNVKLVEKAAKELALDLPEKKLKD